MTTTPRTTRSLLRASAPLVASLLYVFAGPLLAQQAGGTAMIAGRLVQRDASTTPVARALVSLVLAGRELQAALTDDQGRFAFENLSAGRYTMRFSKPGYIGIAYGAKNQRAEGLTLVVADGQRLTTIAGTIAKASVVTGRVTNANGQPLQGALVTAFERVIVSGKPVFRAIQNLQATTDDRGIYRLYGFEAGDYIVGLRSLPAALDSTMTSLSTTRLIKYAKAYAPGVNEVLAASVFRFGIGEEKSGVDIVVPLVPTATVSGRIVLASGEPGTFSLRYAGVTDSPLPPPLSTFQVGASGEFTTPPLEPGQYLFQADGPMPDPSQGRPTAAATPPERLFASADVIVNGRDVTGVMLELRSLPKATGRVAFRATTVEPPAPRGVRVTLQPLTGQGSLGTSGGTAISGADGSFVISGMTPGQYVLKTALPPTSGGSADQPVWIAQTAMAGTRNLLDEVLDVRADAAIPPIEITFTDRRTELSGRLVDRAGNPAPDNSIIVFGTNRAFWRQDARWVRAPKKPSSDGRFSFVGLPPGEYYVAALSSYDPLEWYTPEFLEQVAAGAVKVALTEGTAVVQDLRVQ